MAKITIGTKNYSVFSRQKDFFIESYGREVTKKKYTDEDIKNILASGSLREKRALSRFFFNTNSIYSRILLHYTSLPIDTFLVTPHSTNYKKIGGDSKEGFLKSLEMAELIKDKGWFKKTRFLALLDGICYGAFIKDTKNPKESAFLIFDANECRITKGNIKGEPIIEISSIYLEREFKKFLPIFPSSTRSQTKEEQLWIELDETDTFFPFKVDIMETEVPPLLGIITSILDNQVARTLDKKKLESEIEKIIVQKVPSWGPDDMLFQPTEATEIHQGAADLIEDSEKVSLLTTFLDVQMLDSKTKNNGDTALVERTTKSLYDDAGVSSEIFNSRTSLTTNISLQNDLSFISILLEQQKRIVETILNMCFGTYKYYFTFNLLPVTFYNQKDLISFANSLVAMGYSYFYPAAILGVNQKELIDLKDLENDVLKLGEKLLPLMSTYTQSAKSGENADINKKESGGQVKEEKSEKTEKNIDGEGK